MGQLNGYTLGDHAFSVAQHCILVEGIAATSTGNWTGLAADGATHDATEYVVRYDLALQGGSGLDYKALKGLLAISHVLQPAQTPAK